MNPWKPWTGGECPVPKGTLVDVKFKGISTRVAKPAGILRWGHLKSLGDIIAYRIHEERK